MDVALKKRMNKMKPLSRMWCWRSICCIVVLFLLRTSACADSGQLDSFLTDQLDSITEQLQPSVPKQAQQTMEEFGGGLGELLSMSPQELFEQIVAAAKRQMDGPLEAVGRLIGVALLCAVLGAVRQSAVSNRLQKVFVVVAAGCALSFLGEPVFACIEQTAQSLRECALFVLSFTPVMSGMMIAGGHPASAGVYNLLLFFAAQLTGELAVRTLLPLLSLYFGLCAVSAMAPDLQLDKVTGAIKSAACWGLGILTTLFVGLLSLQTVIGSSGDTMLLKAGKFLAGSMIPVIGGTISDALGAAKSCVQLLKGAVGSFGILVAVLTFLPVLLRVGMWYLSLRAGSWISEMLGAGEIGKLLSSIAQGFAILLALIACFSLLVLVSTALMMAMTA